MRENITQVVAYLEFTTMWIYYSMIPTLSDSEFKILFSLPSGVDAVTVKCPVPVLRIPASQVVLINRFSRLKMVVWTFIQQYTESRIVLLV